MTTSMTNSNTSHHIQQQYELDHQQGKQQQILTEHINSNNSHSHSLSDLNKQNTTIQNNNNNNDEKNPTDKNFKGIGRTENYDSPNSPNSPHSPPHYSNGIVSPSSSISINNDNTNNQNAGNLNNSSNIQFKNYTVRNPPGTQQLLDSSDKNNDLFQRINENYLNTRNNNNNHNLHYPTPNNTPIPSLNGKNNMINNNNINSNNNNTLPLSNTLNLNENNQLKDIKQEQKQEQQHNPLNDKFPPNIARDANGYPILSREFVVRRISEGETGRLKEELKCEACGKGYKHITSLAKHLWEHTAEWQSTKKLLISKHQQAQLLEAASILCSIGEKPSSISSEEIKTENSNIISNTTTNNINNHNTKLYQINHHVPMVRRKSKSEVTKAGKFGGKRRSESFTSHIPVTMTMTNSNHNDNNNNNINNINNNHRRALSGTDHPLKDLESTNINISNNNNNNNNNKSLRYGSSSTGVLSSVRRDSDSTHPPIDLRRSSMHMSPSISLSASRRGSLIGSLIKEEENDAENSLVIYDSEEE